MRSSVPERRCLSPRPGSVPGISDATVNINPLHRIVTVGRSSSYECGSRGLLITPASNHYTLEGGRSRYEVGFALLWRVRQQVVVNAAQSYSVVSGLAEAQVAVSLIIVVVFITFLLLF
jgi:hypothetical protein